MPVHVVGISAGHIWHTIRNNGGGWEPWTDVLTLTGPLANGQPSRVGCAMVDGQLHVGIAHGINQLSTPSVSGQQPGNHGATLLPQDSRQ